MRLLTGCHQCTAERLDADKPADDLPVYFFDLSADGVYVDTCNRGHPLRLVANNTGTLIYRRGDSMRHNPRDRIVAFLRDEKMSSGGVRVPRAKLFALAALAMTAVSCWVRLTPTTPPAMPATPDHQYLVSAGVESGAMVYGVKTYATVSVGGATNTVPLDETTQYGGASSITTNWQGIFQSPCLNSFTTSYVVKYYVFPFIPRSRTFHADSPVASLITRSPALIQIGTQPIRVGRTRQFSAATKDAFECPLDVPVAWSSTNTGIATVDANGNVTGVATGNVRISAAAETVSTSVLINIGPALTGNATPYANAGADSYIDPSGTITLDGSGSFDPDGTTLTYEWAQLSGATATIGDSGARDAVITAPATTGLLTFQLTVTDSSGGTSVDTVAVNVYLLNESPTSDADGDGLPDKWETFGVDVNNDGVAELDLPALGADPLHKDVYLELDYMESGNVSTRIKKEAISAIVAAFSNAPVRNPDGNTGITLHVDDGADGIMIPSTGATWGALSGANAVPYVVNWGDDGAGGSWGWDDFYAVKYADENFNPDRRRVFHYAIAAVGLYYPIAVAGISAGVPSADFVVTVSDASADEQSRVVMHELGHNLGLFHGGGEEVNWKTNYLSIMNYRYSGGLPNRNPSLEWDLNYSRERFETLDERHLDETLGMRPSAHYANYYAYWVTPSNSLASHRLPGPVDWDQDGAQTDDVTVDIDANGTRGPMTGYNDWGNLVFNGGSIGRMSLGARRSVIPVAPDPRRVFRRR